MSELLGFTVFTIPVTGSTRRSYAPKRDRTSRSQPLQRSAAMLVGPRSRLVAQAAPSQPTGQNGPDEPEATPPPAEGQDSSLFLPKQDAMDWRAFRASLVLKEHLKPRQTPSSWGSPWGTYKEPYIAPTAMRQPGHWAHEISAPERGCLLVARNMHGQDPLLQQSVILLTSHATDWDLKDGGEDSTAMSRRSGPSSGFILNKPCLHKRVQEINLRAGLADGFRTRQLYHGGPVSHRHLHVLHSCPDIEGSNEVLEGVYCGGMHHANCMVKEGHVAPHRFRLLAGYVGWGPGLLNEELLERKWWALAASAPLIISFLQGGCPEEVAGSEKDAMFHETLNLANIPMSKRSTGGTMF